MNIIRNEIGSEFWDIPCTEVDNGYFSDETSWFLSGRSALSAIIEDIKKKGNAASVAMPAWCCDSMVKPFVDAEIDVRFYPVFFDKGMLKQDVSAAEGCDIVFLLEYFGYAQLKKENIPSAICIYDLTHSIFSGDNKVGNYTFGSLRKWAGFLTGGFAKGLPAPNLPENEEYIDRRALAMREKRKYMLGFTDAKGYLGIYNEAEEILDESIPAKAFPQDICAAKHLDVAYIKSRRRANAQVLLEALADVAIFKAMKEQDCPMFVPILVPKGKRDELRTFLINNNIFCPAHWPITMYQKPDKQSLYLYENSLSLVCDQRYSPKDMERIVDIYKKFWKG